MTDISLDKDPVARGPPLWEISGLLHDVKKKVSKRPVNAMNGEIFFVFMDKELVKNCPAKTNGPAVISLQ